MSIVIYILLDQGATEEVETVYKLSLFACLASMLVVAVFFAFTILRLHNSRAEAKVPGQLNKKHIVAIFALFLFEIGIFSLTGYRMYGFGGSLRKVSVSIFFTFLFIL